VLRADPDILNVVVQVPLAVLVILVTHLARLVIVQQVATEVTVELEEI
jgi:hypothetical protein